MKFRKAVLSTILAASQIAMVLPNAGAETGETAPNSAQTYSLDSESAITTTPLTSSEAPVPSSSEPVPSATETNPSNDAGQDTPSASSPTTPVPGTEVTPSQDPASSTSPAGAPSTPAPSSSEANPQASTSSTTSAGQLTLMLNSNLMIQDGVQYKAAEPMAVKNGVSYVAIRSLVERVGLSIYYDGKTKETVITRGSDELRFKLNSNTYKVNGVVSTMKGKSYATNKSVFMVPFTSITSALKLNYNLDAKSKKIVLNVSTKPVAKFTVNPAEIVAGETQVTYTPTSSSPSGKKIVSEEWTGREEVFSTPGTYTVTYRVQDETGQWSDPYSVTVNVVRPHTPPVAAFTTDKDTYKMGEKITYTDQSWDEENTITKVEWSNNKLAFFSPGPQTVSLKVTNKYGLTSSVEKVINISNETLYNESDFNKLFVPIGEKYTFAGSQVPSWEKATYSFTTDPVTLIRSNSPETNYSEGILYSETTVGNARFMIHHANAVGKDVKVYVIATNTNTETANLYIDTYGFAGPNENAFATGKLSVDRYFNSMQTRSAEQDIPLAPGEQKVIFSQLSATKLKVGQVISLLSDVYTDYPVQFDVIMIDATKNPLATLPTLNILPRDGVHNRGTYPNATRTIQYDELLGNVPKRLLLGDNDSDPFQDGLDTPFYTQAKNAGNFGVLYKIRTSRVAPNTLITFNPRGGTYVGAILVNGALTELPASGVVNAPNDAVVLYRTGNKEETVDFVFTAAPGSNLSVNLLFQPLPEVKQP